MTQQSCETVHKNGELISIKVAKMIICLTHYYSEIPSSLFLFDRESLMVVFLASPEFSRGSMKVPHNETPVNDEFARILDDRLVDNTISVSLPIQTNGSGTST